MSEILDSFLKCEGELRAYLRKFFSRPQDIEDVVQEAFLKAFATEVRTKVHSPRKLLFTAAKHAAISELKKKVNTTTDYIEDFRGGKVIMDEGQVGADDVLDSKKKLIAFSKAVASLPPKCQEVFVLRKFEGLSQKEIAIKLKISVSAVEKHIAKGVVKCSRYLKDIGYEPAEYGDGPAGRAALAAGGTLREVDADDE